MIALSIAAIVSAGITIGAQYLHPPRLLLVAIFKPLTTILILALALGNGTFTTDPVARAVVFGLAFSLIGDTLLLLPGRAFLYGLLAFLAAHICYIVAFRAGAAYRGFGWVLLALLAIAAMLLRYTWSGIRSVPRVAVVVYVGTIALMASLAVGQSLALPSVPATFAAAGALLFLASDGMLAINRFRRPFRLVHLGVLGTYYVAQLLIALSLSELMETLFMEVQ